MNTETLEKKFLAKQDSPFNLEIIGTDGSYIMAADGKQYIDFTSGWCVGNIGWGRDELKKVIRNYDGPDYVYPGFTYKRWADLAELLASIAPEDLKISFRTTGGTESVETAMQIAMLYTGRKKFCSLEDSYHGNSIAAISIGETNGRDELENYLQGCFKIEPPLTQKTLSKVETRLKTREIAAFIMEPVMMNNGVTIPDPDFMSGLRDLCDQYGTLLVIDEVASGFGRTGKLFGIEHFEIQPDILCLSKAMSGGYAGIGATLTTEKIHKKIKDKINIYSTYGWHPLSTEVAIANIEFITKHQRSLLNNVQARSQQLRTALSEMTFKEKGEMSIIGLALAIDLKEKKYAEKVRDKAFANGLVFTTQEEKLVLFPPLTIEEETVSKAMEILESVV